MRALVVPADPDKPVTVVDLSQGRGSLHNLQQLVGGLVDVQAHEGADIWLNDEGRINGMPINVRASHYVLNDSEMAKQGQVGEWSVLYGDVVVTGPPDRNGDITPVDPKFVDYFEQLSLDRDALRDWDTRDVSIQVTDWDIEPPDHGMDL